MFESPMDLHYSQTAETLQVYHELFESPMDLHYSQTRGHALKIIILFESPMDLHYSQTIYVNGDLFDSLNPLWIYTTLKHHMTQTITE